MKIALLCVGKWEEKYLDEFVLYYKNLGITNIFFGDNNEINNNSQLIVLQKYIDTGFVKYYNYQGITDIQHIFYNDIYFSEKNNYDWYFVCDIDEYLFLDTKYKSICDFLNDKNYKNIDCIKFKWQTMITDDENLIYHYVNLPIQQRFKVKCNITFGLKSIFKYSENIVRIQMHYPVYDNKFYKAIFADSLNDTENNIKETNESIINNFNILLHYRFKSCDEYIDKLVKGTPFAVDNNYYFSKHTVTYFSSKLDNITVLSKELRENIKKYLIEHFIIRLDKLNINYTI